VAVRSKEIIIGIEIGIGIGIKSNGT